MMVVDSVGQVFRKSLERIAYLSFAKSVASAGRHKGCDSVVRGLESSKGLFLIQLDCQGMPKMAWKTHIYACFLIFLRGEGTMMHGLWDLTSLTRE